LDHEKEVETLLLCSGTHAAIRTAPSLLEFWRQEKIACRHLDHRPWSSNSWGEEVASLKEAEAFGKERSEQIMLRKVFQEEKQEIAMRQDFLQEVANVAEERKAFRAEKDRFKQEVVAFEASKIWAERCSPKKRLRLLKRGETSAWRRLTWPSKGRPLRRNTAS